MSETTTNSKKSPGEPQPRKAAVGASDHAHPKLGELASTAICGNDITSSCLYVSALAIISAGKMAPVVLLIVAVLLFLFRAIYGEVVGALPLNGGAYNALLNTTSKPRASVAACLTILSYMATAVISAGEAMHYAGFHDWVIGATLVLLMLFTGLTVLGITESSRVAIGIFVTHLTTLSLLLLCGLIVVFLTKGGMDTLRTNLAAPLEVYKPVDENENFSSLANISTDLSASAQGEESGNDSEDHRYSTPHVVKPISLFNALFFGFAVALLGISGFESSANFVEEQEPGVFPKTLRNMWMAVSFFNPSMAFLAIALIPVAIVQQDPAYETQLLSKMGEIAGGRYFGGPLSVLIRIDAVLVLSGAVLTSFVGVNGLVHRMTLDRCLPQFLLKTNHRGTTHRILIMFFLMSASVLLITQGNIKKLAGVYTISFLTVMALFGIGNILLKVKRAKLPRPVRASWGSVVIAIGAVSVGLIGNAMNNPDNLKVFLSYFFPTMAIIAFMLYRMPLLRLALSMIRAAASWLVGPLHRTANYVRSKIDEINSQQVVFFTRGDNIANLNNAMLYVAANEDTNRIKVVTVVKDMADVPPKLELDLQFLDEAYPTMDIDFVAIVGEFGPELIQKLSKEWHVPTNLMFIGSPGGRLIYGLQELGGVRLII